MKHLDRHTEGPTKGDLKISDGGRLAVVESVDATAISLTSRLSFWQGAWFIDQREGIPFLQAVFIKRPNLDLVRVIMSDAISSHSEIREVRSCTVQYSDAKARVARVDFVALTQSGSVIQSQPLKFSLPQF